MQIGVECLNGIVFDWSSGLLGNLKYQLTKGKSGIRNNFNYRSILVSFFFEIRSGMGSRVSLSPLDCHELRLVWWSELFMRQEGETTTTIFYDEFLGWWIRQVPTIKEFPYDILDFHGDPDPMLPPSGPCGKIGEFSFFIISHF